MHQQYAESDLMDWFGPDLCVDMLVKIGPEACGALITLLEDPEPEIRWCAAEALGTLKDKRATDALIRHLHDDIGGSIAAQSLGQIGDTKAIAALLNALDDTHLKNVVRISAAGALARMDRIEGLDYLKAMIKSSKPEDRAAVAEELGSPRIKCSFELLVSMLADTGPFVKRNAVKSFGKLHDSRVIPLLRRLADDPNSDVSETASSSLEEIEAKPPPASQPGQTVERGE